MLKEKQKIIQACILFALISIAFNINNTALAYNNDDTTYQSNEQLSLDNGYQGAYSTNYDTVTRGKYNDENSNNNSTTNNSDDSNIIIETPEQLLQQLEKTGTLPKSSKIVGKAKNKEGNEAIAISNGDDTSTMVVTVFSDGSLSSDVAVINPNKSSGIDSYTNYYSTAQEQYDYIMNNNELKNDNDIQDINNKIQDSEFISQVSDTLGTSNETTTGTMTGLATVFGLIATGKATKKDTSTKSLTLTNNNNSNQYWNGESSSIDGVFNSCISDYQYDGMTKTTREFLSALTGKFYEETGITLNLTSGYRPDDSNSWHSDGIAFDVTSDYFEGDNGKYYRDLYVNLANSMGGTALDEYPGEPGAIYARGSNIHVSVHNQ